MNILKAVVCTCTCDHQEKLKLNRNSHPITSVTQNALHMFRILISKITVCERDHYTLTKNCTIEAVVILQLFSEFKQNFHGRTTLHLLLLSLPVFFSCCFIISFIFSLASSGGNRVNSMFCLNNLKSRGFKMEKSILIRMEYMVSPGEVSQQNLLLPCSKQKQKSIFSVSIQQVFHKKK